MPLNNPVAETGKFSDHYSEGQRFFLTGIRIVKDVSTKGYGEGDMVLLKIDGLDMELGIWGKYLLAQAGAAERSDLNKWYVVNRRIVPGFGERPVKVLDPFVAPEQDEEDPGF